MNEVKLTARLGRDPELRYTASGIAVANLSVAHKYKDNTSWFTVVAWADVATNTAENIKKGDLVEIVGRFIKNHLNPHTSLLRGYVYQHAQIRYGIPIL